MIATDVPEAEILPPGASGGEDARRVREPGWVARNRETLERARRVGASVTMVAPPHARIPLALACLAIDGVLLAEEARLGGLTRQKLSLRAAALVAEGGSLIASAAWAPRAMARHAGRISAVRRVLSVVERR